MKTQTLGVQAMDLIMYGDIRFNYKDLYDLIAKFDMYKKDKIDYEKVYNDIDAFIGKITLVSTQYMGVLYLKDTLKDKVRVKDFSNIVDTLEELILKDIDYLPNVNSHNKFEIVKNLNKLSYINLLMYDLSKSK